MAFWNSIKMAFKSMWASKMRTFLTMLGVIIGVTTVALLTTVANGATATIMDSLGKESRLVTMLTQNSDKPLTQDKLDWLINTINDQDTTGEYIYTRVAQNEVSIDKASHKVIVSTTMNNVTQEYTMRVGATVRGVDSNFLSVRNLDIFGEFASQDNQCVVDREYVDAYMNGVSNEEAVGSTTFIGGKLTKYTYTFTSSSLEDIQVFYGAICNMCNFYKVTAPEVPTTTNGKITVDSSTGDYVYVDSIKPIDYYDTTTLEGEVKKQLSAIEELPEGQGRHEFDDDYTISISETFDGGKEYTVVGVLIEEDASLMGSGNAAGSMGSIGSGALSALVEYSKTKKGNAYVLLNDHNAFLFPGVIIGNNESITKLESAESLSQVALNGAYFLFDSEETIDASVINISMAMMNLKYEIFKDVYIIPMNTVSQIMSMTMDILMVMLTVIAAVSLIVGGVGIMNIMLVAVSERTREIGIRKAIGAKRSSILMQFLIEALVVSLFGGLLGLLVSFIGSLIIGSLMGIALAMPLWVIAMSLGFCLVIGVAFGMYPAVKASRLQPIDALHQD